MHRNGHTPLRVLLTGSGADEFERALGQQPALSMVRPSANGEVEAARSVDVALHVSASAEEDVTADVASLRTIASAPLILAAYGEPNGIVEAGLRVGAADVLVLPQPPETLLFALKKAAISSLETSELAKVVTVFSPKGGSGKTVLATNLAVAAQRSGIETLLVDFDLQFGDAALTLAVPPRATIADLAASSGDIDEDKLKAFISTDGRASLAVLPAPKRPEEAQIIGQRELHALLETARKAYAAVVVDTGPQFDAPMLAALDRTDQLLLVCNPEVTSLKNVRIGLETIDRLGFPRDRVWIVANRLGAAGGVTLAEIEEALDAKVAFELPDDPAVPSAINRATPIVLTEPSNRFSRSVISLTKLLFGDAPPPTAPAPERRRSLVRGRR